MMAEPASKISDTQMYFAFPSVNLPAQQTKLQGLDKRVFNCLRNGKENAIKADKIASLLNVDARTVTASIQRLRVNHRIPVGSLMVEPFGYYIINNFKDYQKNIRTFEHSALESLKTVEALRQSPFGQMLAIGVEVKETKDGKKDDKKQNN